MMTSTLIVTATTCTAYIALCAFMVPAVGVPVVTGTPTASQRVLMQSPPAHVVCFALFSISTASAYAVGGPRASALAVGVPGTSPPPAGAAAGVLVATPSLAVKAAAIIASASSPASAAVAAAIIASATFPASPAVAAATHIYTIASAAVGAAAITTKASFITSNGCF